MLLLFLYELLVARGVFGERIDFFAGELLLGSVGLLRFFPRPFISSIGMRLAKFEVEVFED
jgi:hypothetical protein